MMGTVQRLLVAVALPAALLVMVPEATAATHRHGHRVNVCWTTACAPLPPPDPSAAKPAFSITRLTGPLQAVAALQSRTAFRGAPSWFRSRAKAALSALSSQLGEPPHGKARAASAGASARPPSPDQVGGIYTQPVSETIDGVKVTGTMTGGGFADRCPRPDGTVHGTFHLLYRISMDASKDGFRISILVDSEIDATYVGHVSHNGGIGSYDVKARFHVLHRALGIAADGRRKQVYGQVVGSADYTAQRYQNGRAIHGGDVSRVGDDTDADARKFALSALNTVDDAAEKNFDEGSTLCNQFHVLLDSTIVDDYSSAPGHSGANTLRLASAGWNGCQYDGQPGSDLICSAKSTYLEADGTVTEQQFCPDGTDYTNTVSDGQGDNLDGWVDYTPGQSSYPGPVTLRIQLYQPTELWTRTGCGDSGSDREPVWLGSFLRFHQATVQPDQSVALTLQPGSSDAQWAHTDFTNAATTDVGDRVSEVTHVTLVHVPETQQGDLPSS